MFQYNYNNDEVFIFKHLVKYRQQTKHIMTQHNLYTKFLIIIDWLSIN